MSDNDGLQPCGTRAAYRRHQRANQTPCQPCRQANNTYLRQYNATRRAEQELAARLATQARQEQAVANMLAQRRRPQ